MIKIDVIYLTRQLADTIREYKGQGYRTFQHGILSISERLDSAIVSHVPSGCHIDEVSAFMKVEETPADVVSKDIIVTLYKGFERGRKTSRALGEGRNIELREWMRSLCKSGDDRGLAQQHNAAGRLLAMPYCRVEP
jgi:hypothetical protein